MAGKEATFLALGERLQSIHHSAQDLAGMGQELVAATSGEHLGEMISILERELVQLRELCKRNRSSDSLEQLAVIRDSLRSLNRLAEDFRRIVRMLGMLGISTRIESARLGSAGIGFMTLADDVQNLAASIVDYSTRIQDSSRELDVMAMSALDQAGNINELQEGCSQKVFENLADNVSRLNEVGRSSAGASRDLSDIFIRAAESIGAMVAAMQFHDIVRQQVEHVAQTAEDMLEQIDERDTGLLDGAEATRFIAWVGDACDLQSRQLENASLRFSTAIEEMRCELVAVEGSLEGVRQTALRITGRDDLGQGDVLEEVGRGVTSITRNLTTLHQSSEEMSRVMGRVSGVVNSLADLVDDIQNVGYQIELIALNASIKAAHTGEKGKALGVLASSIQVLSKEAREHTDQTAVVLERITGASGRLHDAVIGDEDVERIEQSGGALTSVIDRAGSMEKDVHRRVLEMGSLCDGLTTLIRETVSGLVVDEEVARELGNVSDIFTTLSGNAHRFSPKGMEHEYEDKLHAMLDRYTMEAERLVHLGEDLSQHEAGESTEEDWDNVELF